MEKASDIRMFEIFKREKITYNIYETVDFLTDQLIEIQKAKERVWIQTMALESGHFTNLLAKRLIEASNRGVDVKILYDTYSEFITDNAFNQLPYLGKQKNYMKFVREEQKKILDSLSRYCWTFQTNRLGNFFRHVPLSIVWGRDHKKISIIDDNAYIGGVNQTPLDAQRMDFMVKTNNPALVENLSVVFNGSFQESFVSNMIYVCDINNVLLVDEGRRSDSIIMEYAYNEILKEDESITLVSPFLPSGNLRKALNRAVIRGVDVSVVTSQEDQLGFTPRMSQKVHNLRQQKPLFRVNRYPGIIHAKALLLGDHSAIIGSHNFDELFVKLGTEEISLFTKQPEIVSQLIQFCKRLRLTYSNT